MLSLPRLGIFRQGKRLLENWPRLRERCWIFSSETATAFLSSSYHQASPGVMQRMFGLNLEFCWWRSWEQQQAILLGALVVTFWKLAVELCRYCLEVLLRIWAANLGRFLVRFFLPKQQNIKDLSKLKQATKHKLVSKDTQSTKKAEQMKNEIKLLAPQIKAEVMQELRIWGDFWCGFLVWILDADFGTNFGANSWCDLFRRHQTAESRFHKIRTKIQIQIPDTFPCREASLTTHIPLIKGVECLKPLLLQPFWGPKWGWKCPTLTEGGMGCQGGSGRRFNLSNGGHTKRSTVSAWLGAVQRNKAARLDCTLGPIHCLHGTVCFRRRTNVQQLTCKIDLSSSFYYLFLSFVLLELKPFVLKGKVPGEKLWKSAKKCEKVWKLWNDFAL